MSCVQQLRARYALRTSYYACDWLGRQRQVLNYRLFHFHAQVILLLTRRGEQDCRPSFTFFPAMFSAMIFILNSVSYVPKTFLPITRATTSGFNFFICPDLDTPFVLPVTDDAARMSSANSPHINVRTTRLGIPRWYVLWISWDLFSV